MHLLAARFLLCAVTLQLCLAGHIPMPNYGKAPTELVVEYDKSGAEFDVQPVVYHAEGVKEATGVHDFHPFTAQGHFFPHVEDIRVGTGYPTDAVTRTKVFSSDPVFETAEVETSGVMVQALGGTPLIKTVEADATGAELYMRPEMEVIKGIHSGLVAPSGERTVVATGTVTSDLITGIEHPLHVKSVVERLKNPVFVEALHNGRGHPIFVDMVQQRSPVQVEMLRKEKPIHVELLKQEKPIHLRVLRKEKPVGFRVVKEDKPLSVQVIQEELPAKVYMVKGAHEHEVAVHSAGTSDLVKVEHHVAAPTVESIPAAPHYAEHYGPYLAGNTQYAYYTYPFMRNVLHRPQINPYISSLSTTYEKD